MLFFSSYFILIFSVKCVLLKKLEKILGQIVLLQFLFLYHLFSKAILNFLRNQVFKNIFCFLFFSFFSSSKKKILQLTQIKLSGLLKRMQKSFYLMHPNWKLDMKKVFWNLIKMTKILWNLLQVPLIFVLQYLEFPFKASFPWNVRKIFPFFVIILKFFCWMKAMAGNIIPAIATTNAIIAGLIVIEAMKILQKKNDLLRMISLYSIFIFSICFEGVY